MSIKLGQAIYALISGATIALGVNIYHIDAPENTPAPLVVYERSSIAEYTRDGLAGYDSTVIMYIITNKYSEGVDIGAAIIASMNNYKGTVAGIKIQDIRLQNIDELIGDQIFTQKLEFNIRNF